MCFPVYECMLCVSLETGAKIIGIVYTILSIGLMVLFGVPVLLAWSSLPFSRACFYAAMTVFSAALFLSAVLLIAGAFRRKASLMRPWVVTSWCHSVPLMAACVAGMVTLPRRHATADAAAEESCIISFYFVHALLLFYFSSVVNSRRHELQLEKSSKVTERLMYPTIHNQYRDHV